MENRSTTMKNTELIVHLSKGEQLINANLNRYNDHFGSVTVVAHNDKPSYFTANVNWILMEPERTRSEVWNAMVANSEYEWLLFIENSEEIQLDSLSEEHEENFDCWAPALVTMHSDDKIRQFYMSRFVSTARVKEGEALFSGINLPDFTRFVSENGITLSNFPIVIKRSEPLFVGIDHDEELSVKDFSPQLYLIEGHRLYKNRKYTHAAAMYRQCIKMKRLMSYDRLAAVNGLAGCQAEQHRWDQAVTLSESSLSAEPFQAVPYLIQYKIHLLNKQFGRAYEALKLYYEYRHYEHMAIFSKANFDVFIPIEETLNLLSDLSVKLGQKEDALEYLEEIYEIREGQVESGIMHRLLIMSIDLENFVKSVFFFEKIYKEALLNGLDNDLKGQVHDYMDMFMKQGWYEYVYTVYSNLYYSSRKDDEFKRRLIVTMMKTDRIEQAKNLASRVA
jgi:tetratricopeptide (TPR) repeat protein